MSEFIRQFRKLKKLHIGKTVLAVLLGLWAWNQFHKPSTHLEISVEKLKIEIGEKAAVRDHDPPTPPHGTNVVTK